VENDRTGLLVPPGDSRALGSALGRLVAHPELRSRLASAAREWVLPRFGIDAYVAAIAGLYDRLLAAKP
jgi:glycosyltransferase involved in cell wall biosynthesis